MPDPYPNESLQSLLGSWWTTKTPARICRGRLAWAFVPYANDPLRLVAEGRTEATEHGRASFRLEKFNLSQPAAAPKLPVAALPTRKGEERVVYLGKVRPVVILNAPCAVVPPVLRVGAARYQTSPFAIVAPYYGADPDGDRAGWRPELVECIRRCEFPQFMWDSLPFSKTQNSILRLNAMQAISTQQESFDCTEHCLSDNALQLLDEWLRWLMTGELPPKDSILGDAREWLLNPGP